MSADASSSHGPDPSRPRRLRRVQERFVEGTPVRCATTQPTFRPCSRPYAAHAARSSWKCTGSIPTARVVVSADALWTRGRGAWRWRYLRLAGIVEADPRMFSELKESGAHIIGSTVMPLRSASGWPPEPADHRKILLWTERRASPAVTGRRLVPEDDEEQPGGRHDLRAGPAVQRAHDLFQRTWDEKGERRFERRTRRGRIGPIGDQRVHVLGETMRSGGAKSRARICSKSTARGAGCGSPTPISCPTEP